MDLEGIMLGEINQTQKDKSYIPLTHGVKEKSSETQRTDWAAGGCVGAG